MRTTQIHTHIQTVKRKKEGMRRGKRDLFFWQRVFFAAEVLRECERRRGKRRRKRVRNGGGGHRWLDGKA